MKEGSYLEKVRNQYEDYPYPFRNPEDEKVRLIHTYGDPLDRISYYGYAGGKDFSKNFKALVAGGGTGDSVIYLAEQLRHTNAEIFYLDISTASMKISQERAAIRKLDNITWIHESLLNLPSLDIGKFDYISCTGVLHHLNNPQEGLDALKSVLKDDGLIYIMMYGMYGRTGVYQMQELMRMINEPNLSTQEKIQNTRNVLDSLPPTNWFYEDKSKFNDLKTDIGLYDLLLHSQDRAYSIPELYQYVENSDLNINTLLSSHPLLGSYIFSPAAFIKDKPLATKISQLPFKKQAAIAEILLGRNEKHHCYISKQPTLPPSVTQTHYIPAFSINITTQYLENLLQNIKNSPDIVSLTKAIKFKNSPNSYKLLSKINGLRSIKEIIEETQEQLQNQVSFEVLAQEFSYLLTQLSMLYLIFLRHPDVNPYKTCAEMQASLKDFYPMSELIKASNDWKGRMNKTEV